MKNILILTPVYDLPQIRKLSKDTKAILYLCKEKQENENIIVLYYYQWRKTEAVKKFFKLLFTQNHYQNILHKDIYDNDVLLLEHPCIIPHRYKSLTIFDKKYTKIINKYLSDKGIKIDVLVVHFPSRFIKIASMIEAKRKVMILHSFDVDDKNRKNYVKKNADMFNSYGFRSPNIRKSFLNDIKDCKVLKTNFECLSGIPDSMIWENNKYKLWKKNNKLNLIFVGKLNSNKNVATIIKALALLPEWMKFHFTIIGNGSERKKLEYLAKKFSLTDKISFKGEIDRENVYNYLLNSDIFIMLSRKETLGISYLEAMAAGNIVIASKGRGIDGVVENYHNGFLLDPDDIDSLVNLLIYLYNIDERVIFDMRKNIIDTISNYSESNASRHYLDEVIGKNVERGCE